MMIISISLIVLIWLVAGYQAMDFPGRRQRRKEQRDRDAQAAEILNVIDHHDAEILALAKQFARK